jgi:hypothetical protein
MMPAVDINGDTVLFAAGALTQQLPASNTHIDTHYLAISACWCCASAKHQCLLLTTTTLSCRCYNLNPSNCMAVTLAAHFADVMLLVPAGHGVLQVQLKCSSSCKHHSLLLILTTLSLTTYLQVL